MAETERARVGKTLDAVRDVLAPYVDTAMTAAYGPRWDERVADDDAKHKDDGRRYPVSKTDLVVLLKAVIFRRIPPWSGSTRPDPRIRGYASELLNVRHIWAHGEECFNEHARLIDTASRFLQLIDLPLPEGLVAVPTQLESSIDGGGIVVTAALPTNLYEGEIERLGAEAVHLSEMLARATELTPQVLGPEADRQAIVTTGRTAFELLEEADGLEADGHHDAPALRMLLQFVRSAILENELLRVSIVGYLTDVAARTGDFEGASSKSAQLEAWTRVEPRDRSREIIGLARQMDEGSVIANSIVIYCLSELAGDPETPKDEALLLWRDSADRARMLAAMEPGSQWETYIAMFLRREGRLCNDLGRSEEATKAFARADEIIDRYPAADPDLVFPGTVT